MNLNKVLPNYEYVANFIDAPVRPGMICLLDDDKFAPAVHINDVFPALRLAKLTDHGAKGNIKFAAAQDVTFAFGASATSIAGKSQVKLSFKRKNTVAGAMKDAYVETVRFGNLIDKLKDIWTTRGYSNYLDRYVFIYEVVTVASGSLIYSEEKGNEVVLEHEMGQGLSSVVDLASGQFNYVSNKKATLDIIRKTAHRPLFRGFRFDRKWQPQILGA